MTINIMYAYLMFMTKILTFVAVFAGGTIKKNYFQQPNSFNYLFKISAGRNLSILLRCDTFLFFSQIVHDLWISV